MLNDTNSGYEYDAEGRETGSYNQVNGLTGYVYDAEGRRVEKVLVNGFGTPQASTTVENEYLLGLSGEQVSVLGGAGNWLWTNVYAGGKQLATYDSAGTHFTLTDWLGSKRALVNITGASTVAVGEQCQNLPFGDGQNCGGTDPNQLHFTGKQRDTESTNDYFGARYYASNIAGRFLSPDPSGLSYANPNNPQSLNLYAYVRNNPLRFIDPSGMDCLYFNDTGTSIVDGNIDHNSNSGEYAQNGGDWVNGITKASQIQYNASNDTFSVQSSSAFLNYNTTVSAPGSQVSGISCYGNCDTATGYSSSLNVQGLSSQLGASFNNALSYVKSHPVTASFNELIAAQGTYQQSTKTFCLSLGLGASFPPTKALTVGILNRGDMGNWQNVVSGWGYTFGANLFVGDQGSFNSSGRVGGPTLSGVGLSGSYAYGGCKSF